MTLSVSSFIGRYVEPVRQALSVHQSRLKRRPFGMLDRFGLRITPRSKRRATNMIVIGWVLARTRVLQPQDLAYAPSQWAFALQE